MNFKYNLKKKSNYFVMLIFFFSMISTSIFFNGILADSSFTYPNEQITISDAQQKALPKAWTCIVYLDADNNLDSYGVTDINEMELVGSSSQVNIIVLLDREHIGANAYYIQQDSSAVTIGSQTFSVPGLSSEPNMGDPYVLHSFVEYVMLNYPATNYLLDLWDHGSGWETYYEDEATSPINLRTKDPVKGICYDDTNGNDALNTDELGNVLATLSDKIDVLSFDACLMAAAELAYEYRNYVDYMVASEETIPGNGYNYELVFSQLVNNPYMTPEQFSQVIVDKYAQAYSSEPTTTLSAIDCSEMDNFAVALDNFATAMINNMTSSVLGINQAWLDVEYFTSVSYIELSHFCDLVIANVENATIISTANILKTAISNAVIRNHNGASHPEAKGLSIYFPFIESHYSDKYEQRIDLTQTTHWDEFLTTYWATGGGGGLSFQQYIIDDDNSGLSSGNGNGVIDPGEVVEVSVIIRNNGYFAATNVDGMLLTNDDYVYSTTFFCDFLDVNPDQTLTSTTTFVLSIDSDCPPSNYFITFVFAIYSDQFGEQLFHNTMAVGITSVEGGGNFDDAIPLANGQTVASTINGTDIDECIWFKVEVQAGYRLVVIMSGEENTDFDLQLYYDYQAFLVGESVLLSYPEVINIVSSNTGTYYIKVYSFAGSGNFSLSVQMTQSGGINYGSNIGDLAIPIEDGTYNGMLPGPSPWGTTFYRFDANNKKKCTFTLRGPPGTIYDLVLYDVYGNEIAWTTTITSNYPVVLEYKTEYQGRYYLEVEAYSGSGSYSISFDIPKGLGIFLGLEIYWWIIIAAAVVVIIVLWILQRKGIIRLNLQCIGFILSIFSSCQISNNNSGSSGNQNTTVNPPTSSTSPQISSRKRCPYCKTRMHPGQTKCPRCGK